MNLIKPVDALNELKKDLSHESHKEKTSFEKKEIDTPESDELRIEKGLGLDETIKISPIEISFDRISCFFNKIFRGGSK